MRAWFSGHSSPCLCIYSILPDTRDVFKLIFLSSNVNAINKPSGKIVFTVC